MKLLKNNSNYKFLVEKRYNFIKSNIDKESISLEIGAGNSDLEKYLKGSTLIKSDIVYNKNNDLIFDCHKIPFKDNFFDHPSKLENNWILRHFEQKLKKRREVEYETMVNLTKYQFFTKMPHDEAHDIYNLLTINEKEFMTII